MEEEALHKYFPIIQKQYPSAQKKEVEVLCCGVAHSVLKIHNEVFRFPKTKESEVNQQVESVFSKRLEKISSIPISVLHNHRDSESRITYQTCTFIPGSPFTKEFASRLTKDKLTSIAQNIGNLLMQVHALPVDEIRNISVGAPTSAEEYARYFITIIKEDKKVINSLLTSQEWEWIERTTRTYYELSRIHPFELHVIHSDFLPRHIFINDNKHTINGIIDFSFKIGDPARDFMYLERYGELFLKTVYQYYSQRDEYFEQRRTFHAGDFLLGHVYLTTQQKDREEQKRYIKELKTYIASHPLE